MLVAVKTVHRAKIVHCDLKPANFLLVQGSLKLIDFGISKAINNDTTHIVRDNQMGTLNYMSPEALQESTTGRGGGGMIKIGRASDVWSLGCILYEMTYGRPPFAQFSMVQRLTRIMDHGHQIEFPRDPLDGNEDLVDTLQACLQRDPRRRPTIDQLLKHPFLLPHTERRAADVVTVHKDQIKSLLEVFSKAHPEIDPQKLTERIFEQWKQQRQQP